MIIQKRKKMYNRKPRKMNEKCIGSTLQYEYAMGGVDCRIGPHSLSFSTVNKEEYVRNKFDRG